MKNFRIFILVYIGMNLMSADLEKLDLSSPADMFGWIRGVDKTQIEGELSQIAKAQKMVRIAQKEEEAKITKEEILDIIAE